MMEMGYARRDITPPLGAYMSGYGYFLNRRADGVMDRLYARAVAVDMGRERFLLVCCDLLGLDGDTVAAVRETLAQSGWPSDRVMLVCTHTHTGPTVDASMLGCGEPNPAYVTGLADEIIACARAAAQDRAQVTALRVARREIDPVGYNRTDPQGDADNTVKGVLALRKGAPDIALVSYACHPVTLGRGTRISADYPGRVCAALEERGMEAVFLNGVCGDIDPEINRTAWGTGTGETLERYGRAIAGGFLAGLGAEEAPSLRAFTLSIPLALQPMTMEEARALARKASGMDVPGAGAQPQAVVDAWLEAMATRLTGPEAGRETASVAVAALGGAVLAAFPYEAYTVTGRCLAAALPGRVTLALGCADRALGYLPGAADIARGAYGSLASAMIYRRPLFLPGQAETLGERAGEGIAQRLEGKAD